MMPKTFYIETLGCQMNVLDSELATAGLIELGFEPTTEQKEADVILFNTCSIRQHAEDKVYSALGRLRKWKSDDPKRLLGVLGCMAQKDKELIFRRAPHVDLVLGPGQLGQLPVVVQEILSELDTNLRSCFASAPENARNGSLHRLEVSLDRGKSRHEEVKESFEKFDPHRLPQVRENRFQAMVRIMFGCDKFCTYCVVPSVRGPEQSRSPQEIEQELRVLAEQGCLEVTFIGQTVNSYRYKSGEKTTRLSDLLEMANGIDGIKRVRFITNYPRGMTDELLFAVRDLPKVAPYFHVPAQSGSDDVLKRMSRHYTVSEYRELVQRIRDTVPGAAITSDFIVGFCGETEDEFSQTKELVQSCEFKNSFIFKYSERPGTKAAELYPDDVPEEVKKRRNNELLEIQDAISLKLNRDFIGQTVSTLVDGKSEKP
ncbi:MAG: MiaB/RimO family radical SAM methylthiotransferase, partial [Thermoguttaceae bacterium]